MEFLLPAVALLGSAVVCVVLAKRFGLGAVIGYMAAGAVVGPWGLHVVSDTSDMHEFADMGVVLMLFVIGLELQPSRLWTMRRLVFGLGGLQVGVVTVLFAAIGLALGLAWQAALVVGLALSLSSTALALQTLGEKGQLTTRHGRAAFAILLFQDLVAIPILALVPLLGDGGGVTELSGPEILLKAGTVIIALAAIAVGGRYLLRPLLRAVARTRINDAFTANALFIVIGTAVIAESVGLSAALGAFLAGVLLADSEYRHALEAVIDPFKGVLLGLFFMAVGMAVNFGLLASAPLEVAGLLIGLIAIKFGAHYAIARRRLPSDQSAILAASIAQGGEFAFVIFDIAAGARVLGEELSQLLVLAVTLSLMATPAIMFLAERIARPHNRKRSMEASKIEEENQVIIAGFGRYGQVVGRILRAKKIPFTALEDDPDQIDFVAKFGAKVYYGDATRLEVLRAAHAGTASIFVLAVEDVEQSLRIAETVVRHFPNLTVLARARDRQHAYRLMDIGVTLINRELLLSSIDTARQVMEQLGVDSYEATRVTEAFRRSDQRQLQEMHAAWTDEERQIAATLAWTKELEQIFEQDVAAEKTG